jgi:hypothetical protein
LNMSHSAFAPPTPRAEIAMGGRYVVGKGRFRVV